MHSTNYRNTLILPSPDTSATQPTTPTRAGSIAQLQHLLLSDRPHELTSDDLLFEVYALRNDIPVDAREGARAIFFDKPHACLRASPLVKQFGWAIYHDVNERVALVRPGSEAFKTLSGRDDVKFINGMRSKRA